MAYDNGVTVYDAGDTCLFSDMQLISQMYGPQVAILPWAASTHHWGARGRPRRQPDPGRHRHPCHYGPELGQPADIAELSRQVAFLSPGTAVVPLEPGQSVVYTASSYEVSG